jgi:hypothetical protein
MTRPRFVHRLTGIVAGLIAVHVLLAYGLPEWLFLTLTIAIGVLYWRIGALNAATVSVTLVFITVFYWAALKITGLEDSIYYRPDDKYTSFDYENSHRRYEANVQFDQPMAFGDLRAMTRQDAATADIAEPRRMRFHSDSDGFRNDDDYHGQRYLLVGDSFIAGISNGQEDLLVTQLRRDHGLDTYSLAYPGNLADYAAYIRGFVHRHGQDARVLLFLFEGNDFEESRGRKQNVVARYGRRYYAMFSGLNTYRVTMSLLKRSTRTRENGNVVELAELTGRKLAFYKDYAEIARRAQWPEPEGFERTLASLQPYLARVYFIPDKYRVYYKHLGTGKPLPDAQWNYLDGLCRKYALRCTNLTAPLARESDVLLRHGRFTWWRDDTHWNRSGIAVAARVVAADLRADAAAGR